MTPRAVIDASAALHLVMDGKNSEPIADWLDEADLITAPDLFTCEVANGLWKYVGHGDLTAAAAATRLEDALALTASLVPGRLLVHEALVAASTYRYPVYDMMYAVLARRQGAVVVTLDARFAQVLRGMHVEVFYPGGHDLVS
jgi:predicted nucleic acid-binding protein